MYIVKVGAYATRGIGIIPHVRRRTDWHFEMVRLNLSVAKLAITLFNPCVISFVCDTWICFYSDRVWQLILRLPHQIYLDRIYFKYARHAIRSVGVEPRTSTARDEIKTEIYKLHSLFAVNEGLVRPAVRLWFLAGHSLGRWEPGLPVVPTLIAAWLIVS